MKYIEDKLEDLDNIFASKKESEKWMIIIGIAGIIIYLTYVYLLPYAENLYNKSEHTKKKIEKNINKNISYLDSITLNGDIDFYIKKFDNDILI